MKSRNETQSKHIANSLRILGYGLSEVMAYKVLKTKEV